jgi:hypothetical protein
MRCLKRRLSDTVYRQLLKRHQRHDLTQRRQLDGRNPALRPLSLITFLFRC